MKKLYFFFFLTFALLASYGQESEELLSEENEIIDSLLGEGTEEDFLKSATNFHFLNFSIDYNNKTYFSGRDIGTDQFNISPQLTYINSKGFFAGVTSIYFSEFDPKWDYTSVTIGYGKNFGKSKNFRWSTSYAKYFYTNTSEDNPFTNAISLGIEVDNKKKTFGTELSTTYLFGSDNSFQIISSTYGVISFLKTKKSHLKLQPQLNIVAAQQTIQLSQTFTIRGRQFTRTVQNNDFGLINTQFQIPLQYNISDFSFEAGYIINFPSALKGETNLKTTSTINLSMSYLFDL